MDEIEPQILLLRQMYIGLDKKSRKDGTRYTSARPLRTHVRAREEHRVMGKLTI